MKTWPFIAALCMASALVATPAHAENWVMAVDDGPYWMEVDVDSISARQDGLVAARVRGGELADTVYDCKAKIRYVTRLEVMGGIDYPNWRENGSSIVPGSIGEKAMEFVCARARR
jgi:hypothetical protein